MARKRIADKEPPVSSIGAATAPATTPANSAVPGTNQARAPRASATAVTHKHKKSATIESEILAPTAVEATPIPPPPTRDEIAIRAYLLAESRGFRGGSPEDDWFKAERQLRAERQIANARSRK
jgi:Protein of unknown function (DUF2934)